MKFFYTNISQFTKTRLMLSFWYTFILLLILIAFSLALSVVYNNDVTRIVLKQDFGNHVPRTLSKIALSLVRAQVRELRMTSTFDLFIIDMITLAIGAGLSYFLAGKTLAPIQKNILSQKLFIADASHELRSPIANIQTACEVVLRSPTKSKEDYKKVLKQVFDQSQRLGRLANDLLLLSVLDTSDSSKVFQLCSLSSLVEKELDAMCPVFKKAGLTVEKSIMPQVSVYGDADKLRQLIVILLDNATKYTPSGGKIVVEVHNQPQTQLIIQDTGIGIALEKQKDIFKRFYQGDASHTGSGAGLGLAIATSIMHLHTGHIKVISSLGEGSTFVCIFPTSKNI